LKLEYSVYYLEKQGGCILEQRDLGTKALRFSWTLPNLNELRSEVIQMGLGREEIVIKRDKEDLEELLSSLAKLVDYSKFEQSENQENGVKEIDLASMKKRDLATEALFFYGGM
jgi:hypothetical protein